MEKSTDDFNKMLCSQLQVARLKMLKYFDNEVIDRLLNSIDNYTDQQTKKISNEYQEIQLKPPHEETDKEFHLGMLDDENFFLDEVKKLSYELAIIALYKKLEITTKRVVKAAYSDISEKKLSKLSNIENLEKYLEDKGINIKSFKCYNAINEVRLLNNTIKHSGIVGGQLAAYSGWNEGDSLENYDIKTAYLRLAPLCFRYIEELIDNILQKLPKSNYAEQNQTS